MVAGPRNHRYLQRKGLGFRGPFALYRGSAHSGEVAPQLDAQLLPASRWGQHNSVHQTTKGFGRLRAGLGLLEGPVKLKSLRPVDAGHLRVQEGQRLVFRIELSRQILSACLFLQYLRAAYDAETLRLDAGERPKCRANRATFPT